MKLHKDQVYSLSSLCGLLGLSRQAYYQHKEFNYERLIAEGFVLEHVRKLRKKAPQLGCRKLYVMCKEYFGELLSMGRDQFLCLLRRHGLMLRLKKRRICKTTDSSHSYPLHPDLAKGFVPSAINQLWVSDITYIWTEKGFCFLSLVTDAYSHSIVGWRLAPTLKYKYTEEALRMAIDGTSSSLEGLIHHSDRGFQYAYKLYTDLLGKNQIRISMTQSSDPRDNAIAERMNGILKQEWLNYHQFTDMEHVRKVLEPAIEFYNTERPHSSVGMLTPAQAALCTGELKNLWKPKKKSEADLVVANKAAIAFLCGDNQTMETF